MEKLNPDAIAEWGEESGAPSEDIRPGVQPVDSDMIFAYVTETDELPLDVSARAFANWLDGMWYEYSEPETYTNRQVIESALVDWRGGK